MPGGLSNVSLGAPNLSTIVSSHKRSYIFSDGRGGVAVIAPLSLPRLLYLMPHVSCDLTRERESERRSSQQHFKAPSSSQGRSLC